MYDEIFCQITDALLDYCFTATPPMQRAGVVMKDEFYPWKRGK